MDKDLLGIVILAFILCVIWTIAGHNKVMKQVKLNQLRDIKSNINNALSLYDCLYIHINMYSKGFTGSKSLASDGIIFLLDNLSSKTVMFKEGTLEYIEGHYEADSETYKTALATYKSRLNSEVDLELDRYNY
ncbi:MAG: hypothetical protein [Bacteriophage sp.]|nr:MAG: hypothetical protein [Bacteriophage sp.]